MVASRAVNRRLLVAFCLSAVAVCVGCVQAERSDLDGQTPGGLLLANALQPTTAAAGTIVLGGTTSGSINEGNTAQFTVRFAEATSGAVTITSATPASVSVSPATLTFTTADATTAQTVTATAVEDLNIAAETVVISVAGGTQTSTVSYSTIDNDKVMFSSTITLGNIGGGGGGFAMADAFCNGNANKPSTPSGATYKAMIVDGVGRRACSTANCAGGASENIDWVLKPNTTYFQANGTSPVMTTNGAGIFVFGTMTNPPGTSGLLHFTGLINDWTSSGNHCTNWTNGGGGNGRYGTDTNVDATSIDSGLNVACNVNNHVYCVQQ